MGAHGHNTSTATARRPASRAGAPLTPVILRMNAKTIRILSFLGKTAGLVLTVAGPFSGTPVGLTVFAVSSFLKDAVNRMGDLADDGKPNDSFKT